MPDMGLSTPEATVPPGGLILKGVFGERYLTGVLQVVRTHSSKVCKRESCVIHKPSVHKMIGMPTAWDDRIGIMYRQCEHGDLHLDPDEINRDGYECEDETCDGCCQ